MSGLTSFCVTGVCWAIARMSWHSQKTAMTPRLLSRWGRRAFSPAVSVTQRHTADRDHLETDLRFSVAWVDLLEAHGPLAEVPVEAASGGGADKYAGAGA